MRVHSKGLHTEPITAERVWMADDIPVLTASYTLPQPVASCSRVHRRIGRYYQAQGKAFLRYCQCALLPVATAEYQAALTASAPLPCFCAELHYQVTWNSGGYWSLYTESVERTGSSPALHIRHGDTWDLSTGYPVSLSSLFPPKANWKKALLTAAAEEISRQERCGMAQYEPNWQHLLRRRFQSKNFYLTPEGLRFFFPMYALAPAAEGIPTFTLSYESALFKGTSFDRSQM